MSRQRWIFASACCLGAFLLLVALQPLLESGYDPLRQGISEFVHSDPGVLMVVGFLAWAMSLAVLAALMVSSDRGSEERPFQLQGAALAAAVVGLLLVSAFETDRGAELAGLVSEATTAGRLHDLGSALVTGAFLLAVLIDVRKRNRRAFAFILMAVAIASSGILFALGDPLPGLRQRCLIAVACIWQMALLRRLWIEGTTLDRSSEGSRCSTS